MSKRISEKTCAAAPNPADEPKVLALLREAQARDGYVTQDAVGRIAKQSGFTESEISGVASFYLMLYLKPTGKFVIRVCSSPSCVVNGGSRTLEWAREILGIGEGETTRNGLFTLEAVSCFGRCETAPNAMVNEENYGHIDSKEKMKQLIANLKKKAGK